MKEEQKTNPVVLSWKRLFGDVQNWDDPSVLDKLRKRAIAVIYGALQGKNVTKLQYDAAETVLGKMVAPHTTQQVHFHLSLAEIQKAQQRAGLIPIPGKVIPEKSEVAQNSPSSSLSESLKKP